MANPLRDGTAGLIGGQYAVDFTQPLPHAAPPLAAFAATRGGRPGFVAVAVARGWPARARTLGGLAGLVCPSLLVPLAHGAAAAPDGAVGYYVICPAPPGPSLAEQRSWSEAELLEQLLKPAAQALAALESRNATHRAIRPENVFQAGPSKPVTLGCAWATPPGCHQPAWMEPPTMAGCLAAGRGDGVVADDVYALGALMLALAIGANPVEGVPDGVLLRRKLEVGSYAALVGTHRPPPAVADLLRGMLADDPEHRPSPALLANPAAARARRIAARPPRRAQQPVEVGPDPAWTARVLAHDIAADPAAGAARLREGGIGRWMHRALGDSVAAVQVDSIVQQRDAEAASGVDRADAMMVMRAVAVLDPAAPLVWRTVSLWPEALGPALDNALHVRPELAASLGEIAALQLPAEWGKHRAVEQVVPDQLDASTLRGWSATSKAGALPLRLAYTLNPLAPCGSPMISQSWVTRLADVLPALEDALGRSPRPEGPLIDASLAAFIEARRDERLDSDLSRLAAMVTPGDAPSQLRLLARLEAKLRPGDLPLLSRRAAELVQPLLGRYSSLSRRERLSGGLATLAVAGRLAPIVALLDNPAEHASDDAGLSAANARLAAIEAALAELSTKSPQRLADRQRVAGEIAEGIGMVACVIALAMAVFG